MKKITILLLFTLFIMVVGCFQKHYASYDINLKKVERPSNAKERYGETKIIRFVEDEETKYSFEDGMIKIIWLPGTSQFNFFLTNKTSHSIKIIWDEAVYVNESGISDKVMHNGVKYSERNNSQPPTVIIRGATASDTVLPTDNVYYSGKWRESPLFPDYEFKRPEIDKKAKNIVGKNVQNLIKLCYANRDK